MSKNYCVSQSLLLSILMIVLIPSTALAEYVGFGYVNVGSSNDKLYIWKFCTASTQNEAYRCITAILKSQGSQWQSWTRFLQPEKWNAIAVAGGESWTYAFSNNNTKPQALTNALNQCNNKRNQRMSKCEVIVWQTGEDITAP